MAVVGMDIAQVREFAALCDKKAGEIDTLISDISNKLQNTQWVGQDAQTFRSDWSGQATNQLKAVAQLLRDTKTTANNNANAQEDTSNKLT